MLGVKQELVRNGDFRAAGQVGNALADVGWDPGYFRPYRDEKNRSCVNIRTGRMIPLKRDGKIVTNKAGEVIEVPETEKVATADLLLNYGMGSVVHNDAVLTVRQWVTMTNQVVKAFRQRLRAWTDLESAVPFGDFDGMSTLAVGYQSMSDPGEAVMDMDGISQGRGDQGVFKLVETPAPITHADFSIGDRMRRVSARNGMTPIDVSMGEAMSRRVAEVIEKTTIGVTAGPILGDATTGVAGNATAFASGVYGYKNHPNRNLKTDFTAPTTGGWVGKTLVDEVLASIEQLRADGCYGPFMVYHSTDWSQYMDGDYLISSSSGLNPTTTLRERVKEIDDVSDVRRLDYLTAADDPFTIIIVEMNSEKIQAANGLDVTVLQWPTMGGLQLNFKVMAIKFPIIKVDYNGNCGVLHGTIS